MFSHANEHRESTQHFTKANSPPVFKCCVDCNRLYFKLITGVSSFWLTSWNQGFKYSQEITGLTMRFFVPRKSLRNGPMTTGVLRHLTESTGPSWEQKMQTWGLNSQSEPMGPPQSQHRPTTGSPHCMSSTNRKCRLGNPCGYAIAVQLHQIHQLAVKMNIKKMFKTLKTLGRKQSRNEYKPTRSFHFVSREFT